MRRCRSCPPLPGEVRRAADLLERRWALAVVYACRSGAVRFNEIGQSLGTIPPRTLAQRLVDLEDAGLLLRVVRDTRPPQVEYRLTQDGVRLGEIVESLGRWSAGCEGIGC
ncbi:MAG: helix-turn-helix transcriptional regulator [Actinomycetota bacterium]|nr:helix-turn-helix transcriptional regulator [Actinomycetota bacterium]